MLTQITIQVLNLWFILYWVLNSVGDLWVLNSVGDLRVLNSVGDIRVLFKPVPDSGSDSLHCVCNFLILEH